MFNAVSRQEFLAEGDKAALRLYVAPSLGYVVPRYEYIGRDGKLLCRFDASDFKEVAPAVFFPKKASRLRYKKGPALYIDFEFANLQFINGVVPEDDFHFEIPQGTHVSDGRKGKHKSFVAGERVSTKDLDQWYDRTVAPLPESEQESGVRLWIIVVNVLIVLAVAAFLLAGRFRRKPA